MRLRLRYASAKLLCGAALLYGAVPATAQTVAVPVVKCSLDTMTGPGHVSAPATRVARVSKTWGAQIAFYSIGNLGAFGPRGWHCAGHAGSSGEVAFVAPGTPPDLGANLQGRTVMQFAWYLGGTSGRFSVAGIGAPLFAEMRPVARSVASTFGSPVGRTQPYPGEKVRRVSANVASFIDPPGMHGSGAGSGGANSSYGVVTLLWGAAGNAQPRVPDLRIFSITAPARSAGLMQTLATLNGR